MNTSDISRPESGRTVYFDILRIAAIAGVIILHVLTEFMYDFSSLQWKIMNVVDCALRWPAPIFIMISGALFLNPEKPLSAKKLFGKNLLRLVTAFFFWSLVLAVFLPEYASYPTFFENIFKGNYTSWFLFALAGLYIITPFLRKIAESEKLSAYFILISIAYMLMIQLARIPELKIFEFFNNSLYIAPGYASYFVLGHYLSKKELSKAQQYIIYFFGIASAVFMTVMTATFLDPYYYEYLTVYVFAESGCLYIRKISAVENQVP